LRWQNNVAYKRWRDQRLPFPMDPPEPSILSMNGVAVAIDKDEFISLERAGSGDRNKPAPALLI
jgi:hypothetical protein